MQKSSSSIFNHTFLLVYSYTWLKKRSPISEVICLRLLKQSKINEPIYNKYTLTKEHNKSEICMKWSTPKPLVDLTCHRNHKITCLPINSFVCERSELFQRKPYEI